MEIKKTEFITVLSAKRRITIAEIAAVSAELCPALMEDAEQHGLKVNGPWIFVSHSLPRDEHTAFKAEFCLPVDAAPSYQGVYVLKTLEPILCASRHYEGPLRSLFTDGYGPLLRTIDAAGHVLSDESREVYHHWRGPDAADNQIEIQFGLRR